MSNHDTPEDVLMYEFVIERVLEILEEQADAIDGRIPDATGGKFAKKFAANAIRACAGLIKQEFGVSSS